VIEWKPPKEELQAQWMAELGNPTLSPPTLEREQIIERAGERILSSYLFDMLSDPERMAENAVRAIYRLWQVDATGFQCSLCKTPVVCGQAGFDLLRKVDLMLENKIVDLSTQEIVALVYQADPGLAETLVRDKEEVWLLNYLQGLDFTSLSAARERLATSIG
jgi:hypothetical protein